LKLHTGFCVDIIVVILFLFSIYYESRKRELKTRLTYEDRCDERLKLKLRNLHDSHALG
jgi:hypothetical protein